MMFYSNKENLEQRTKDDVIRVANLPETIKEAIEDNYYIDDSYDIVPTEICCISAEKDKVVFQDGLLLLNVADAKIEPLTNSMIEEDLKVNTSEYLEGGTVAQVLLVQHGFSLSTLMDSHEKAVLVNIVRQNYKLDEFKRSKYSVVRAAVAKQGAYLDELVEDKSSVVRAAVASKTENPEHIAKLANYDESTDVKIALAKRNIKSDMLAHDLDTLVRIAVAEHGNRSVLEVLVGDSSDKVKAAAVKNANFDEKLAKEALITNEEGEYVNNRYIRVEIAKKAIENHWMDIITELSSDGTVEVRSELAKAGVMTDKFLTDSEACVRQLAYLARA